MNNKLLKILNPLLFLALLTVVVAVALYKLPNQFRGTELMEEIHTLAGLVFFALGFLHIILNWKWIKSQVFGIKPKKVVHKRKRKVVKPQPKI